MPHLWQHADIQHYEPIWHYDILQKRHLKTRPSEISLPPFKNNAYYFKQTFFYHDLDGNILHYLDLKEHQYVSAGRDHYALYEKVNDFIHFFDRQGLPLWRYETSMYPMVSPSGHKALLISSDGSSIMVVDRNLNVMLKQTFLSKLITDISYCPFNGAFAVGTIEGTIIVYNHQNTMQAVFTAPESKRNFVKTVFMSDYGNYIAGCSGMEPEYVFVINKEGKLLWKVRSQENNTTSINLYIHEASKRLVRKELDTIILYNVLNGDVVKTIPLDKETLGNIQYVLYDISDERLLILITAHKLRRMLLYDMKEDSLFRRDILARYFVKGELAKGGFALVYTSESMFVFAER